LDYRKIVEVLNELKNKDFPILATTATANNRVIEDLKSQIGPSLYVSKGSLYRDNLYIQLLDLKSKVNRYAWILKNIQSLKGTGIIYC
jgi:ATP-dependent DNA helicase RecQ